MRFLSGLKGMAQRSLAFLGTRRGYVLSFMVLAILFVPVWFCFGLADLIAPCCWTLYELLSSLPRALSYRGLLHWGSIALYVGLFFVAARASFWLSQRLGLLGHPLRLLLLATLLAASFQRSIQYSALRYGVSGTYNFWEACARYAKTQGQLLTERR